MSLYIYVVVETGYLQLIDNTVDNEVHVSSINVMAEQNAGNSNEFG